MFLNAVDSTLLHYYNFLAAVAEFECWGFHLYNKVLRLSLRKFRSYVDTVDVFFYCDPLGKQADHIFYGDVV
jgi:hypothetical protein